MDPCPRFSFICGDDEFIVAEKAKAWYARTSAGICEDLSKEVIDARAQNVDEVQRVIERFSEAIQTQSLFGDKKVVWLKSVNFLANSQTGNAQGTLDLLEILKAKLISIDTQAVSVLISASPVYKVRNFYKWCVEHADFEFLESGKEGQSALGQRIAETCSKESVEISQSALQLLFEKIGGNSRMIAMEAEKLVTYVGEGGQISEALVNEMVPNFGEGDFFEATDAFFSGQVEWALTAVQRHFFTQSEGRPLLGSLQSRNRLMIQLRMLVDSGELKVSSRGIQKQELSRLADKYKRHFGDDTTKSNLNIFTQNPFYLGRLTKDVHRFSLKQLIDFQIAFAETFEALLERPKEQEALFKQLAIRCLGI